MGADVGRRVRLVAVVPSLSESCGSGVSPVTESCTEGERPTFANFLSIDNQFHPHQLGRIMRAHERQGRSHPGPSPSWPRRGRPSFACRLPVHDKTS